MQRATNVGPRFAVACRRFLAAAAAAAALLLGRAGPAAAQDAKVVELAPGGDVSDWALDEATGRVFATLYDGGKVVELDPATGKPVREFPLGDKPRQMVVKAGKLAVSVEAGTSVYVVDLKSSAVEGRVQLPGIGPTALFASAADNPYVYAACTAADRNPPGGAEVFQIDLLQRKSRKSVQAARWNSGQVGNVALSADGQWALVDGRRGAAQPAGLALLKFDEAECTGAEVFNHPGLPGQVTPDPYSRHWAVAGDLYARDARTKVRPFRGQAVGFHPTADLVAGLAGPGWRPRDEHGDRSIEIQTFSTAELLREVKLVTGRAARRPPPSQLRTDPPTGWADDPFVRFDARNDRLMAGYRGTAHLIDIKSLDLLVKPLVVIDVPSVVSLNLGQPMRLPLALRDPALTGGTKFSLVSAPAGMRVEDGHLVWAPAPDDIGEHAVRLRAERGGSSDALAMAVVVRRPSVELGGDLRDLVIDPAGARALAFVTPPPDPSKPRQLDQFGNPRGPAELVLIDLKALRVTARRTVDEYVQAIALTADGAFAAHVNVARIQRFKLADLSDDGRTFTGGNVARMEPLPWGDLAVHSHAGVHRYDGQKVSPAGWASPPAFQGPYDPYGLGPSVARVNGGTVVGPMVVDDRTKAVRMFRSAPAGLPVLASDPRPGPPGPPGEPGGPLGLWGRRLVNQQITGPGNVVVGKVGPGPSVVLEAYPAVATLTVEAEGAEPRARVVRVEFRDLIVGDRVAALTLSSSPVDPRRGTVQPDPSRSRPVERGGVLYVGVDDRVYAVEPPADRLKALPVPLHYVQRLEPVQAPVGGVVTIRPELVGGKGNRTFELPGSPDETSIDPQTGVITIDTGRAWQQHLEAVMNGRQTVALGYPASRPSAGPVEQAQATFRAVVGSDPGPDASPLALHVRVVARDEENQAAELSGCMVLLGPKQEAVAAIERRAAAARAARAAAPAVPPPPGGGMPFPRAVDGGFPTEAAELRRQVAELEQRNQQLQAKIDLLTELIREKANGPGTRPAR